MITNKYLKGFKRLALFLATTSAITASVVEDIIYGMGMFVSVAFVMLLIYCAWMISWAVMLWIVDGFKQNEKNDQPIPANETIQEGRSFRLFRWDRGE